ncbi:ATP-binding protein [Deltaproteobacteria bacterium TL4]
MLPQLSREYSRTHRLSFRVLFYILLCSTIFTVIGTAFQLYTEYQRDLEKINEGLNLVKDGYLKPLTLSVWTIDERQLATQLEGLLLMPDIRNVQVFNPARQLLASAGSSLGNRVDVHEFPLIYRDQMIGTLHVTADLNQVYARMQNRILLILSTQIIKTFLWSFLVLFIFHQLIMRHIHTMTTYLQKFDVGHMERPLTLERKQTASSESDELDQVVNALNQMRSNLIAYIDERKRAEEERFKLEVRLQQSQKIEAVGTLAGGIAHDLNNILFGMMGYTELVRQRLPPGSELKGELDQVLIGGNRAKELIRQILTFSRRTEVNRTPLEIVPLIKESLKFMRASLPTTIRIDQHIEVSRSTILGDPAQFHQILVNLCTNAGYAMKQTGGVLDVSLREVEVKPELAELYELNEGLYLKLSVRDTGHGMSAKVKERIFEPFYTTKPQGEGTGLGLSVVHGIVKSLQGTITVSSEEGKGSLFELFFPCMTVTIAPVAEKIQHTPRGKEHILLVEDEELLIKMITKMLEKLGYRVTAVMNSTAALDVFLSTPEQFALILTDQTMPVMTGAELGEKIIKLHPQTPLILMTGYAKLIAEEKAKEIGFRQYLVKPFDQYELANAIREVLDG